MKIEQVTKADHARRIDAWYQKAINDPTVFPFLATSNWRGAPPAADSDWSEAYFMDDRDLALLSVKLDHVRRYASVGLWVLEGNTGVAALMMRYAICKMPKRFGVTHLTFCIQENNTAWREQAMRVAGKWMWGREPEASINLEGGRDFDCLNFKVPLSAISRKRGVQEPRKVKAITPDDIGEITEAAIKRYALA